MFGNTLSFNKLPIKDHSYIFLSNTVADRIKFLELEFNILLYNVYGFLLK